MLECSWILCPFVTSDTELLLAHLLNIVANRLRSPSQEPTYMADDGPSARNSLGNDISIPDKRTTSVISGSRTAYRYKRYKTCPARLGWSICKLLKHRVGAKNRTAVKWRWTCRLQLKGYRRMLYMCMWVQLHITRNSGTGSKIFLPLKLMEPTENYDDSQQREAAIPMSAGLPTLLHLLIYEVYCTQILKYYTKSSIY